MSFFIALADVEDCKRIRFWSLIGLGPTLLLYIIHLLFYSIPVSTLDHRWNAILQQPFFFMYFMCRQDIHVMKASGWSKDGVSTRFAYTIWYILNPVQTTDSIHCVIVVKTWARNLFWCNWMKHLSNKEMALQTHLSVHCNRNRYVLIWSLRDDHYSW